MEQEQQKEIEKQLAKENSCFILITCAEPSSDGNMEVEMTYGGDIVLASYLLQGAQSLIDEQTEDEEELCSSSQNLRLVD